MWRLLIASLVSIAATDIDVSVQKLDGTIIDGQIIGLSDESLSIATSGGDTMLSLRDLTSVTPLLPISRDFGSPQVWVELIDGSKLPGQTFQVSKGQALMGLLDGRQLTVSTRRIRWALFRSHDKLPLVRRQWEQLSRADISGDTIVLRKESRIGPDNASGEQQTVFALDSLEGVLHDITQQYVNFDFDGDAIAVSRQSKVEGVIYYHPPGEKLADCVCQLIGSDGSHWQLKSFGLEGQRVDFETTAGVQFAMPLEQVVKFDLSAANTQFLSDLTPSSIEWVPYLGAGASQSMLEKLYRPRMDRAIGGGELSLYSKRGFAKGKHKIHEKAFDKGIAIHSRTLLEYELSGRFDRFRATAGIDPRVRGRGSVRLLIRGDRQVLCEEVIQGSDDEPVELDVSVAGIRRLTILVDFGEETDISDYLNLCHARLTR